MPKATPIERDEDFLTAEDVARILRITPRHLRTMRKRRRVPEPIPFGAALRWDREKFDAWRKSGCPDCAVAGATGT